MISDDKTACTRVRLLEVAIVCFAQKGFAATSIREVAKRARANSALVQYHFGGKNGLYLEALNYIFNMRPIEKLNICSSDQEIDQLEARRRAIQTIGDLIENRLDALAICGQGSEFDKACLLLVMRELQNPRENVTALILQYLQPFYETMLNCLNTLRPDLDQFTALNYIQSIIGQIVHLHYHIALIRVFRNDPSYPRDMKSVAKHITEFSLRGIGIPEAYQGL